VQPVRSPRLAALVLRVTGFADRAVSRVPALDTVAGHFVAVLPRQAVRSERARHAAAAAGGAIRPTRITTLPIVVTQDAGLAAQVAVVRFGRAIVAALAALLALPRHAVAGELRSAVFVHQAMDAALQGITTWRAGGTVVVQDAREAFAALRIAMQTRQWAIRVGQA
jgi:hypothetical protein